MKIIDFLTGSVNRGQIKIWKIIAAICIVVAIIVCLATCGHSSGGHIEKAMIEKDSSLEKKSAQLLKENDQLEKKKGKFDADIKSDDTIIQTDENTYARSNQSFSEADHLRVASVPQLDSFWSRFRTPN